MSERKKVIVKYGSTVSTNETGMDRERLKRYAPQLAQVAADHDLTLVVSGATKTGEALSTKSQAISKRHKAAFGSARSFVAWQESLEDVGLEGVPILVTNHEIDSPEGGTLSKLLGEISAARSVALINGNDALSLEGQQELAIDEDNDQLAGHIAKLLHVDHTILVTDRPGLLDEHDLVVPLVTKENFRWALGLAGPSEQGGRGGMHSKVLVGLARAFSGHHAHIIGEQADLMAAMRGEEGTYFQPAA